MTFLDKSSHLFLKKDSLVSEWDVLKGIGALCLPFVHTVETFLLCDLISGNNTAFCNAVMALTVFGPSVFMICMGIKLANIHNSRTLFRYGRTLFFIGLLLNFLRSVIPSVIVIAVTGSSADHLVSFLFLSDIYLFAGLFYILLGLFRKIKISIWDIALITMLMLTVNCFLSGLAETKSETVNAIMGNIVYVDDGSVFPLLSWTVFPVFGMLIGNFTKNKTEKGTDKICIISLCIATVMLAVMGTWLYLTGNDALRIAVSPLNDNKTDLINIILVLCLNVIAIVFVRFFIRIVRAEKLQHWLGWLSTNLMVFYFVHWCILTLICYSAAAVLTLSDATAGIGLILLIAILVNVLTIFVVKKFGFKVMKCILKVVHI